MMQTNKSDNYDTLRGLTIDNRHLQGSDRKGTR